MNANQNLETEKKAIEERIAAATGGDKELLQRQYGERLAHLAARIAPTAGAPEPASEQEPAAAPPRKKR